ncbi:MAG: asparagine synthase (glutamine-hydrolyzing) [Myxococcota bacterium]
MCGIAGIIDFDRSSEASRAGLEWMQAQLRHRGPDGEGSVFVEHAALAHTRLAMVDVSGGQQPLVSPDGRYHLIYNGELYNDAELRAQLGGPWRSRCDAETVLAAWARWGTQTPHHLDGMFSFFLWDAQRGEGHGVRDRLGVKPFVFRRTPNGLSFASEAKALLGPGTGAVRADLEAIVEYLVAPAFSGVERAMFEGLEILPPGHRLQVSRDGITQLAYWRWSPGADPAVGASELGEALHDAIGAACIADAPLGVFLSGGLDSTLIAARARAQVPDLVALTVAFDGQERWTSRDSAIVVSDDTPFARMAARELELEAYFVPFERTTMDAELRGLVRSNDALPAWEQELSQRTLAKAAAQRGLKGILVGDAADETHYGYHFLLDDVATRRPRNILERLGAVAIRPEVDADPLETLDRRYRERLERQGERFSDPASRVAATTRLVVERWLPRLLHNGDVHCMAFGVEPRVPFAANAVLACAQAIEPTRALAEGVEKTVLREAVRGWVPEPIRVRRKSALPKDQDVGRIYQGLIHELAQAPHPLVEAVVDLSRLREPAPLDEPRRAAMFRVACLQRWAEAYGVAAP